MEFPGKKSWRVGESPRLQVLAAVLVLAATPAAFAASVPTSWDHLVKVKSKQFDQVYLLPGADFRSYTKVLIDPVQVAFRKDWQRNLNNSASDVSRRISNDDAARIIERTRVGAAKIFTDAFRAAGYEIATEAAPDALRLSPNIIDLYITAPNTMSAGRSRTYTMGAGEATLALEAHDSVSGELLGRAVDRERAGDSSMRLSWTTDVTNTADFERLYRRWAAQSVKGLQKLKDQSPLGPDGKPSAPGSAR